MSRIRPLQVGNLRGSYIVRRPPFLRVMQLPQVFEPRGLRYNSHTEGEPPFVAPLSIIATRGPIASTSAGPLLCDDP